MEYIYSAMLLHSAGKKVTAENLKKVQMMLELKH
jgi:ribosomal protein L12E/L44/L45/RPP1/RPP2